MSGIDDWSDLMPLTVTVQPFVSRTPYGTPSYASPASYAARVNYKAHDIRRPDGQVVTARGMVWLASADQIAADSLVTLPDGSTPLILESAAVTDETGGILYVRLDFA